MYIAPAFFLGVSVSFSGRSFLGRLRKTYYSCTLCLEIISEVVDALSQSVGTAYKPGPNESPPRNLSKTLIMNKTTSTLNWLASLKIGTEIDVSEDHKYLRKVGARPFFSLLCSPDDPG